MTAMSPVGPATTRSGLDLVGSPARLSAEWLTGVLRANGLDAEVRGFEARNVGTGQIGECVRITLDYARAAAGAPATLVGKFPSPKADSRATGIGLGNYLREVRFYQHLAATARIRTPRAWFADMDEASGDFALIMEDLAPAVQGDQMRGCTLAEAERVIDEAAKLHSSHWNDRSIDDLAWVNDTRDAPVFVTQPLVEQTWAAFLTRYVDMVSPFAREVGDRLSRNFDAHRLGYRGPKCLVHVDFRPDNMMFGDLDGPSPVAVVDWQSVSWGCGATDISYFLGGALTPEVRRANEAALLRRYHEAMQRLGVQDHDWDALRRNYAYYSFHLFMVAFFASMIVTRTERGDRMFFTMLNGAAAHVADCDALSLLP
jgi:hypothetical protein